MPDTQALREMYGANYRQSIQSSDGIRDPKRPEWALEWLKHRPIGTFVDYGCGAGLLLEQAKNLGWESIGIEFDDEVARSIESLRGVRVVTDPKALQRNGIPLADVLYMGDVIEHLTDLERQFAEIIGLIRPRGTLLAQGPLEAGPTFFTWIFRMLRRITGPKWVNMPPYHVIMATVEGQQELFRRFGLQTLVYQIEEVGWPAPDRLTVHVLRHPRLLALFSLRRISKLVRASCPRALGNRYYFVGEVAPGFGGPEQAGLAIESWSS